MAGRFSAPRVLRFPCNTEGRDFVVGDVHGAFTLVVQGMRQAKFNPAVDRLFAVGDLIDRGDESARVAKFLAQPYVHAVRGNHEDALTALYENGPPDPEVLRVVARWQGMGEWWFHTVDSVRQDILTAISRLPLAIEVETERGTVGLIHADVPKGMSWPQFLAALEVGDSCAINTCLEGRDRIKRDDHSGVEGVGRVFVGHTIRHGGPSQFGNVFAIDTGAIFGLKSEGVRPGHLSMARLDANTAALIASHKDPVLVDLKDSAPNSVMPFGQYSISPAPAPRG